MNDLLSFTAYQDPQRETFLVCDLVNEVCDSLEPQLDAQAIEVDRDVPPHTLLHADREMMQRAILNLVLNAVDAMPKGGHLVITSYEGPFGFELEIADSGPGLNEEEKKRSKLDMKKALVGEESIIEEIANYLLKTSLMGAK